MSKAKTRVVKFIRTVKVRDAEGREFKEGETHELPEASAQRWIRRNAAVEHTAPPAPSKPAGYKGMPKAFEVEGGDPVPAADAIARALADSELEVADWNKQKPAEKQERVGAAVAAIVSERG